MILAQCNENSVTELEPAFIISYKCHLMAHPTFAADSMDLTETMHGE
jgi:hypothetical protein